MSHIVETLQERRRMKHKEINREFQLIGAEEGSGYAFPCKADGSPDEEDENYSYWIKNYQMCLAHPKKYEDLGVVTTQWDYMEPARVRCSCGEKLWLSGDTRCSCGQWYNQYGQELKDPQCWGDGGCY